MSGRIQDIFLFTKMYLTNEDTEYEVAEAPEENSSSSDAFLI